MPELPEKRGAGGAQVKLRHSKSTNAVRPREHYEILCHLSRLMALKGQLVSSQMDDIIATTDWSLYSTETSLLSYLAVKSDGAEWILRLLDIVPNDARDGLFTACWYCSDARVQAKLVKKFDEWITEDPTWGGGDREDVWLGYFLGKWISEGTFSYEKLKKLIVWHFRHEHKINVAAPSAS